MPNPTNLYQYYQGQGKSLPSVAERATLAAQHGITGYTGTAEQNNALLSKLTGTGGSGTLPPSSMPPGGLNPTLGTTPEFGGQTISGDSLANMKKVLDAALTEASQNTARDRLATMSGLGLLPKGIEPSIFTAALGVAQAGLAQGQASVASEALDAWKEKQKTDEAKKTSAFNMINTVIDNGVLPDTPAGTLLAWEKEAGLPEGTALAWQARLKIAQKQGDEKTALELQNLRKEISDKLTTPASSFIDIIQAYINAGSTPQEAARKAAMASEAQGIPVDQKTLNSWTEQAGKLVKSAPLSAPPSSPLPLTAREKGKSIRTTLSYYPEAQAETFAKISGAVESVGSFFSGLFGD